jgi:hypothetical protein
MMINNRRKRTRAEYEDYLRERLKEPLLSPDAIQRHLDLFQQAWERRWQHPRGSDARPGTGEWRRAKPAHDPLIEQVSATMAAIDGYCLRAAQAIEMGWASPKALERIRQCLAQADLDKRYAASQVDNGYFTMSEEEYNRQTAGIHGMPWPPAEYPAADEEGDTADS